MSSARSVRRWGSATFGSLGLLISSVATGQIPPPQFEAARSADLVARRVMILADEQARLDASGRPRPAAVANLGDGSTRFEPLAEVVTAAEARPDSAVPPLEAARRTEVAGKLFDLALRAAQTPSPPLAFVDECLRDVLKRDPNHAETRRLLGFVPHEGSGWATPFAAQELKAGKVKDPTFGWVAADWVPHLRRGELPAPRSAGRWLPADQADALRRDWKSCWQISTEHFEIYANVPLSGVIAFGRHLEAFDQLFGATMADLIGSERLPLARRLRNQQPIATRRHQVYYFATREEYAQFLAPFAGGDARESLGIYVPRKESAAFGTRSYFFNDVGGQLDVTDTLYHEISHQLLFELAGADDYLRNGGNYWVFEGLGTYFETLRTLDDGSIRVGGLVGPRLAQARKRLVDDRELVPLELFVGMDRGPFQGKKGEAVIFLHYAEAMALAVFLMQADDGRYREPFLDYARDAYKGQLRRQTGRTLEDRLDRPYADLQREFLAYLGRTVAPPPAAAQPSR